MSLTGGVMIESLTSTEETQSPESMLAMQTTDMFGWAYGVVWLKHRKKLG